MTRKIVWGVVSGLMVLSLVLASCAPKVTEEKEVVTPPTEKEKEVVVTPPTEKEVVPAGPEMVKVTLKKLDGTVVEKMVEKPKYGGTISTAFPSDPSSFDPFDVQGTTNTNFARFVYENLQIGDYTRSPSGTNEHAFTHFYYVPAKFEVPHLTESWELADPQTYIWHIRKGVRWQNIPPVNGRELTAADVVYAFLRMKSSPRMVYRFFGAVVSMEATDKYTVVTKLKEPNYVWMEIVGDAALAPVFAREMVEKYGSLNDWHSACGTGPWILADYVRGSVLTFKKNPDYWKKDPFLPENTLPYADIVKELIIPDLSTRISAVRTGKIDVLIDHYPGIACWQDAESLKKTAPDVGQRAFVGAGGLISMMFRIDKPPFNDIRVRQAMLLAVDQNAILEGYLRGYGALHNYPIESSMGEDLWTPIEKLPTEPTLPGSKCSARELYTYNPTKAKQLLAEAGYPDGFKTDVICLVTEVDVTSLVAAYWKDIGVDLAIHVKDIPVKSMMVTAIPRTYAEGLAVQTVNANNPAIVWPAEFQTNGTYNVGNISDPHIDQTILAMNAEPDQAKRNKMCKDLCVYAVEQAYKLVGPHSYEYNFWQPWVKRCEGASRLGQWGMGLSFAYYWVDQDLKYEMTGKR